MSVVRRLETLELTNDSGETVLLGSTWRDHSVVLVFLRHFG